MGWGDRGEYAGKAWPRRTQPARGAQLGLDVHPSLNAFDSGNFLAASGDLLHTGPTATNVMDLVLIYKATHA